MAALAVGPGLVESRLNPVRGGGGPVSARAADLHRRLLVADMHADTLLWGRDLLRRGTRGQVDLPRLHEGNVALQAFTVVTKSPRGLNIEKNSADAFDDITPLAILQRWPPRAWFSLRARALHQAGRLREMAERSGGTLVLLRSRADLRALLERRRSEPKSWEPGWAWKARTRWRTTSQPGRARRRRVPHDRAHALLRQRMGGLRARSAAGRPDRQGPRARARPGERATSFSTWPTPHPPPSTTRWPWPRAGGRVAHRRTGTCDNRRNLSDKHLRGVAATGGVVGIGFWSTAVCGADEAAIARAVVHAVRVAGADHVGLGSDFDGAVTTPFDAAGLPRLTDALLRAGLSQEDVGKVMGRNVARVLGQALP